MGQLREEDSSIRSQLTRIVLIPSVTFLVLFAVLSVSTLVQAVSLKIAATDGQVAADLYRAEGEIQTERRLAAEYLGATENGLAAEERDAYRDQFAATDAALAPVLSAVDELAERGTSHSAQGARGVLRAYEESGSLRASVLDGEATFEEAVAEYTTLTAAGHHLYDAGARSVRDGDSVAQGVVTVELARAQDAFSHADALLSGAAASGEIGPERRAEFTGLIERGRSGLPAVARNLEAEPRESVDELLGGSAWSRLDDQAREIAEHEGPVQVAPGSGDEDGDSGAAVDMAEWREDADTVLAELVEAGEGQWSTMLDTADAAGNHRLSWAIGGGIMAFFAGALAYGVASRSSRRLIHRLLSLRSDTLNLARDDLPRLIADLEQGRRVDPKREVQLLDYGSDEIGQVASAFNTAQRTAVLAAVRQAEIREGANRVFLAIAHRNQSLVQRQLQLLDRIERQEDDPDLLEQLFHLDHLATRGRRHAENLIILGSGRPGRRWKEPVPLTDVLRGAISETEDYTRIKLHRVPEVSLGGAVVADVIHLLAELAENATAFSPPHTGVHLYSEIVPHGVVVEVEDRGLGMSEEDVQAANRTLAEAPEFDVMALKEDARLGLFVVARLARKHEISVYLRASPYGGMRAIVLLPTALLAEPPSSHGALNGAARKPSLAAHHAAARNEPLESAENGRHAPPSAAPSDNHAREHGTLPHSGAIRRIPRTTTPYPSPPQALPAEATQWNRPVPTRRDTGSEEGQEAGRPTLPRRRRQANLAPQLRGEATLGGRTARPESTSRPPEEVRRAMAAVQSGTRRARGDTQGELPREPHANGSEESP